MLKMTGNALLVFTMVCMGAEAAFSPTLTIDGCTKNSLQMTLDGATDEGIIYIQNQDAICRQPTSAVSTVHTFDFGTCGIQWEETFNVVVQQRYMYMTGEDKQIPVMCMADLQDLTVANNINMTENVNEEGQNITVKPTAYMTLLRNGEDIGGQTVNLGDPISMVIKLDEDYIEDFDIKAKYCAADNFNIVMDSCAVDTELFSHMSRLQQGTLEATFTAFRTTSLYSGAVFMPFTCTLQVCLGLCSATTCIDGEESYGRKRRGVAKRQADVEYAALDDISVGMTMSVAAGQVSIEDPANDDEVCMASGAFTAAVISMTTGLGVSTMSSVVLYKKLLSTRAALSKGISLSKTSYLKSDAKIRSDRSKWYSETPLNRTLCKPDTPLNRTDCPVPIFFIYNLPL